MTGSASSTDITNLGAYLDGAGRRLKRRNILRGAAAMALAVLVLTLLIAAALVAFVPATGWVLGARIGLYLMLVLAVAGILRIRFSRRQSADTLEAMIPTFDGRLRTWNDASQRNENTPLLNLLARDAETVARSSPLTAVIPAWQFLLPGFVAGLATVAFLWLLGAGPSGPSPLQLSALRLWTGDLFMAAAPRIAVSPGDTVVPRGSDVVIEASASGFVTSAMQLHAEFDGTAGWETAPMARLGDGRYGFVFVGVNEEVVYYVGATGINSERHVIRVADLPRVTDVVLEYRYPDWTELPVTEHREGDIAALPGTRIGVAASTDAPVSNPLIVVNGEVLDADAEGNLIHAAFEIGEPGSWHVAVRHEGTLARISDSFFIDVVSDQPPEVAFSWPGHDVQATAIEERVLRFAAKDDYGLSSLTFHYAINGGRWVTAELPPPVPAADDPVTDDHEQASAMNVQTSEYTLYLEDLEVSPLPTESSGRPLRAGDMISFYAEARDHAQESRTALYFIDIRPYDRTYRESQSMAGQGNQGGGADELVQRQREIVTATWNLINRQSQGEGAPDDADQAEVLALLQRTLADQVTTLIERAAARRLMLDEEIDTFTRELTNATEDMIPAAEQLAGQNLEAAVAPAQQALQHLLAAQATVNDVDVSMGTADMRGTAGRSLSELMDLEMDRERNRYETPQNPSLGNEPPSEREEWQQLKALADRQEAIARQQGLGDESLASRWQQERLQRELEQLQESLERRQRQAAQQNPASQSTSNGSQQRLDTALSELERAQQSIRQSLAQQQTDAAASRQATEAIRRASDELRKEAAGQLDERLIESERIVQNLLADQRTIMSRLDEIQDDALASYDSVVRRFDDYAMAPYAERKRRMQADLNNLSRELDDLSDVIEDDDTVAVLADASRELADERLDERLAASADAFEFGRPLYAIGNEAVVEQALERLGRRLEQARRQLAASDGQSRESSTLTEVRELRDELAELISGNDLDDMESLLRRTDALEMRLGQEIGPGVALDTAFSRQAYRERGTDSANSEALAQLMSDRLDLLEAALMNLDAEPIRAQEPRDQARDSDAAARYFETLSRP